MVFVKSNFLLIIVFFCTINLRFIFQRIFNAKKFQQQFLYIFKIKKKFKNLKIIFIYCPHHPKFSSKKGPTYVIQLVNHQPKKN